MLVINGSTCLSPNVPMFVNKVSPKSRYIYTCFDLLSIIATAVTKSFYSEFGIKMCIPDDSNGPSREAASYS